MAQSRTICITTVTLTDNSTWTPIRPCWNCNGFVMKNQSNAAVTVASDPADPNSQDTLGVGDQVLVPAAMPRPALAHWETQSDMWRFHPSEDVLYLRGVGSFPQIIKFWWVA